MQHLRAYLQKINSSNKVSLIEYLLLFIILFITLYYAFASYAIENMNEGLYAEIPREMMVMGNYIIPHLNFVPYLEKPPLLYWLIALSYHTFGVSAFAARLIPVTAGAMTCVAVFLFAKAIQEEKHGWIATIVLGTSAGFILISRVIIFDMLLTAFFTSALLFFYLWYEKEKRLYLWLSYASLGLAFLTKGMVGVALAFIIVTLFMWLNKTDWKKFFKLFDIVGIGIFLLIVLPWLIIASLTQPGFAWDFFINEQVYRFLNKRFPSDYHHGSIFYYILPLIVILMPWSTLLPTLLKKNKTFTKQKVLRKFLWLWFSVPFIFFSLSQAKAQYYIIIGIPALAILISMKIDEYFKNNNAKPLTIIFVLLFTVGMVLLGLACLSLYSTKFAAMLPDNWQLPTPLAFPLFVLWLVLIVYGIGSLLINYLYPIPIVQFLLIAGLMIPWMFFYSVHKQRLQPYRSEITLGQYILSHDPNRPVYLYRNYEELSTALFYIKKRIYIIDSKSKDLYYGSTTPEAKGWFITSADFVNQSKKQAVYVVLFADKLPLFNQTVTTGEFCQVSKSGDVLLLSNKAGDCHFPYPRESGDP